ncbi:GLPGLI family protein [Winogradskyella immobilis]|uniref:GLPGLI family protein n=1 Tax=Winogradskyella immobilis TaxID=2816852 RepID=A0ABS8EIT5_9FLAO|nr:GLPGLI family protein [Winogradskyella immobilis]MCC1482957.1 GLPGLI family protein [Winogradskyella immobilis]MCG0015052.1 GLPGLI family protein [Winogradskyella immobilis]
MKLNTGFLILISILAFNTVYSQNGYAYYQKQLLTENDDTTNDYMKQAIKQLETQEYQLSFNKTYASYKLVNSPNKSGDLVVNSYTDAIAGFDGIIYFNRNSKTSIHKKEFSGHTYLITKDHIKWTLTNDTLKINDYVCYKATTTRIIENSEGKHSIKVSAWYTPGIKLPYGPDGYGGLPGLVLQLENNGTLTTLKKIEFLKTNSVATVSPKDGRYIIEEEFNAIVEKQFKNRGSYKN